MPSELPEPPRPPKKRLTDLELEIMHVIWEAHPRASTVRDVVEGLERHGHSLAYTTVQTVMGILKKKQVLGSRPGPGRAHEYRALVTRDEATSSMTADFVSRLFGGEAKPLVAHLLDHGSFDRDELVELKRRIETQLSDDEEDV
ncbi:MAG TPA: BlaI/MecI/CopY family transcriptional regulator [Planctomycetes bacterium]|nr:BlaI/MecI/CopY family transcriptional regulator [Planctomycetota bacterium]